jgi:acetylglutamate kinase
VHTQAKKSILPADAVLKFLASVGPGSEAELYLRLFRARAPERFATIVIEPAVVEQHLEQVAVDVRFLGELGLYPALVLDLDTRDARHAADRLRGALHHAGVSCELIGEAQASPARGIATATARRVVPLWCAPGAERAARSDALAQMLSELGTEKLIFLRPEGGIWLAGRRVSVVNLSTDYDTLALEPALDAPTRALIADCQKLVLQLVPQRLLIALTSPLDLLRELFTVKGAGTLLRRGVRIERFEGYMGVNLARLTALLEASFGKPLNPKFLERRADHAYIEESYRGAGIVMRTELGGYLSKFAVTREAQGEGIGQDLWSAITADYAALFWRSRSDNPIRAWYERQCQGRYQAGAWTVYFRGLRPSDVPLAIERALAEPLDF